MKRLAVTLAAVAALAGGTVHANDSEWFVFVMPFDHVDDPHDYPFNEWFPQLEGRTLCGWEQHDKPTVEALQAIADDPTRHPSHPDSPGGRRLVQTEWARLGGLDDAFVIRQTVGCVSSTSTSTTPPGQTTTTTTTTTTPETTTTWPDTTSSTTSTTVPPPPTLPGSSSTSSTTPSITAPTTTAPESTSTSSPPTSSSPSNPPPTSGAVTTPPTSVSPPVPVLPATGAGNGVTWLAAFLVAAGAALTTTARRGLARAT